MPAQNLVGTTALVTGATRGFGRAITSALVGAGAKVVAVARDTAALAALADEHAPSVIPATADAADPITAGRLLDEHRPDVLVLNAGANPPAGPIQSQTWESFSRPWELDVKQAFHWTREALLLPLDPGSTVISVSSAAAIGGSPLSGGYAGAKATVRFVAGYAAEESERASLGIRFVSVLPMLSPTTGVGTTAATAYADRQGMTTEAFRDGMGPTLTPDQLSQAVLDIASDPVFTERAYLVKPSGPLPL